MDTSQIQIENIPVWRLEATDGPQNAQHAFQHLTQMLGTLGEGRDCYGLARHEDGKLRYWACFLRKPDDPGFEGAESFNIPAGTYLKTELKNWQQHVHQIGSLFEELAKKATPYPAGYGVEYYIGRDMELWLAVQPA